MPLLPLHLILTHNMCISIQLIRIQQFYDNFRVTVVHDSEWQPIKFVTTMILILLEDDANKDRGNIEEIKVSSWWWRRDDQDDADEQSKQADLSFEWKKDFSYFLFALNIITKILRMHAYIHKWVYKNAGIYL